MPRGGKRDGAGRKKGDPRNKRGSKKTTPEELLARMLPVPAGPRIDHDEAETIEAEPVNAEFGRKPQYVDPVSFCQALINNDVEVLSMLGIMRPPDLEERLIAAKIAAPYTNKKKPTETVNRFEVSWADEIRAAESRADNLRMDVRNGDRKPTETTH